MKFGQDITARQRVAARGVQRVVALSLSLLAWANGLSSAALADDSPALRTSPGVLLGHVQTLRDAESLALESDPLIREAIWNQRLSDARLLEARLKRLPVLKVIDLFAYSNSPFYVFGSLLQQNRVKQSDLSNLHDLNHPSPVANFVGSAYFSLPIFNQFQTNTKIAQQRLATKQAVKRKDRAAQETRFLLIQKFYGVMLAESKRDVSAEAVRSTEAELSRTKDLRDVGKVVNSDVLAIELQLAQFKQDQLSADGALCIACAEFSSLTGGPITSPVHVRGKLVDKTWPLVEEDLLVDSALKMRPDLEIERLEIAREHEEILKAKGKYLPNIKGFGGAILSGQGVVNATPNFAVGGLMTWDFDPSRPAIVRQARAGEQVARANCDQKMKLVSLEVIRAFQQFRVAAGSKAVSMGAVAKAKENLRIVKDRYQLGLTAVTELLRAQTFFVQAETNYLNAVYENYVDYANLLLAVGQLTEVNTFEG